MNRVLPASWDLPEIFHRRMGQRAGKQRAMAHEGHLLLILHEVPEPGSRERSGLFFWRDVEGSWRSSQGGRGLGHLVQLLDRYSQRIDHLEEMLRTADEAHDLFEVTRIGNPLLRAADNLRRALQQAREASDDRDIIALRDRAQDIDRAAELVIDDAKNALDYAIARQAEESSRVERQLAQSTQRLNRIAALFLPLTAVASVFSASLDPGLDLSSPIIFWAILAVSLLVGFLLGRARRGPDAPSGHTPSPAPTLVLRAADASR